MSAGKKSDAVEDHQKPEEYDLVFTDPTTSKEYMVDKFLGSGAFSKVWSCFDTVDKKSVALKLGRRTQQDYAKTELELLSKLKSFKDANKYVIQFIESFKYKECLAIVTEKMEMSLYAYHSRELKAKRRLNLNQIRRILHDVLKGLTILKEMDIIHTDIKPENIMMRNCGDVTALEIKLIDFGSAHYTDDQDDDPHIQTTSYMSPEVILHCLPYSHAIDLWSVGCILAELLIRANLYPGKCQYDQLRYIVENQGLPTEKMMRNGKRSHLFFTKIEETFTLKSAEEFLDNIEQKDGSRHDGHDNITETMVIYERYEAVSLETMSENKDVVDLLEALLQLDPHQRISAKRALQHPFFQVPAEAKSDQPQLAKGPGSHLTQ